MASHSVLMHAANTPSPAGVAAPPLPHSPVVAAAPSPTSDAASAKEPCVRPLIDTDRHGPIRTGMHGPARDRARSVGIKNISASIVAMANDVASPADFGTALRDARKKSKIYLIVKN